MSKITIVTDSTAYIPSDLVAQYDIKVAPQVLIWDGQTLLDDVDIKSDAFFSRLKTSKTMATTSQVNPKTFYDIFKPESEMGNEILAITISVDLSKTFDSARQAKEMLSNPPIELVDSRTTAMALGFIVLAAARAVQDGANLKEAKALAEKAKDHVGVVFTVETLEFLHRGGRIGTGKRFLGTALNIKPIMEVTGGKVEAIESVRTRSKSLARVVDIISERIGGRTPVRLATLHANSPVDARQILELGTSQLSPIESIFASVSPVVANHAGPGTVGLAFMAGM